MTFPGAASTVGAMPSPFLDVESEESLAEAEGAGFRFGSRGTHTSRTIMLAELADLLAGVPAGSGRDAYVASVVEDNLLGKPTAATRRDTFQRLTELYGLDRRVSVFRVLRRLWEADEPGRPLLAMLCSLARDPLLRATAPAILELPTGGELVRTTFLSGLRDAVGSRLNERTLDKVARNAGSSWAQSGHLRGRVRKVRQRVRPTAGSVAMAMWLGSVEGLAGSQLLTCRWVRVLDRTGDALVDTVLEARQQGLLHARVDAGIVEIDLRGLDAPLMGS